MYGNDQERYKKKIDAFEVWCCRRLLRISWTDKKTNFWVLNKIGKRLTIRKSILERKLGYCGHIVRRDGGMSSDILDRCCEDCMFTYGVYGAAKLASDRRWRALVKTTAAHLYAIWTKRERVFLWIPTPKMSTKSVNPMSSLGVCHYFLEL